MAIRPPPPIRPDSGSGAARGWDERGESLEELQGCEVQRGAPVRQGARWCVEQTRYFPVGPAQAVQGERRSGRVGQEAFEAGAVPRFEANRSVYREPSRGGARGTSAGRCRARANPGVRSIGARADAPRFRRPRWKWGLRLALKRCRKDTC
jgi:hypothetical protein